MRGLACVEEGDCHVNDLVAKLLVQVGYCGGAAIANLGVGAVEPVLVDPEDLRSRFRVSTEGRWEERRMSVGRIWRGHQPEPQL